jgi:tubulin-folding cofactor B
VHGTGAGVIPGAGSALPGRGASMATDSSDAYLDASCAAHVVLGQRCSVSPGDRRGEVCYIGQVKGLASGYWIGVRLDEPQGKNDGSIKDVRYFEASKNFGSFARPPKVTCGDYPEKGLDEEEEEEEEGKDNEGEDEL